jgi:hypothetical protein
MKRVSVTVRERDGAVELIINSQAKDEDPTVVVLDGMTARKIGDDMYRAGCNTGL